MPALLRATGALRLSEPSAPSGAVTGPELREHVSRVFLEWRDDVYRYLLTVGLSPPEAQEATQEVFLRLYTALSKQQEPILNQRAWIFRVAHNLGLTLRARNTASQPFDVQIAASLQDSAADPESGVIEREKMQHIRRAIESLSPQQRHCLELRAEGLRYQEIADTLGISVSTVSEFLKRAVLRLRKAVYE